MIPAARHARTRTGAGFTLIELLLVVVLILLLMGASVFNFSSLQSHAGLTEGVTQFEALLRFSRAHAQTSGRNVLLRFDHANPAAGTSASAPSGGAGIPRVLWEPDPLGQPGQYQDVFEAQFYLQNMRDQIRVARWRWGDSPERALGQPEGELETTPVLTDADGFAQEPPPVMFFPDGSSDSFEVDLMSQETRDSRRIRLRVDGVTGGLTRETLRSEEPGLPEPPREAESASPRTEEVR
ncbi:MAG: GspH/FimT family pseudopilin [Verrucomicrobia bacterium]|nr:GspH/FimT family pseudopilin [Verrucomicrobiota bacterium]